MSRRPVEQDDVGLPVLGVTLVGRSLVGYGGFVGHTPESTAWLADACRRDPVASESWPRVSDSPSSAPAAPSPASAHRKDVHGPPYAERTAPRGLRGAHRRHRRRRGDAFELPRVRLLGDLLAGAARRARRPQAGPASHPLHDGRHEPAARPRARQERPGRRRGHGPAPPPRRRRDLRRAGAAGPAVVAAAAVHRRPRQLRVAGRRSRRHALHRVPDGSPPPSR